MNKIILILLLIIFLVILSLVKLNPQQSKSYVLIDNIKIYVDVARTQNEQERGLAIYNSLPVNRGMIFPFSSSDYYAFWMKDMKFSNDIIYIDKNKIVDIFENVLPPISADEALPVYRPRDRADMVLEINSGLSKKYNFKIGESVKINY